MDNKTAGALALALVAGVAGLGMVPGAMASHTNCHAAFSIAPSEILAAERDLLADTFEVGGTSVVMGVEKVLHVELVEDNTDGELTWIVYHETSSGCVQYTDGGCDEDNVLTFPTEVTCTLNAPSSKSYWVRFEETGDIEDIVYKTWTV